MRTRWRLMIGVLLLAGAAVGGWRWARSSTAPAVKSPPTPLISDPAVAAAVDRAANEVVAHPADAAAWGRLGQTFLANDIRGPARECLAEAARLDPADPSWPYLEAVSLLLSDPVAAMPCWQRAAECPGSDDRATVARLRWAEALLAENRLAEAEAVLRQLRPQPGHIVRLEFDLGLLDMARGDTKEAVEHLRKCIDEPAARRKAYNHLSVLHTQLGDSTAAAEDGRKVEQLPPDSGWSDPFLETYLAYTVGRDGLFLQAEKQQQMGNYRQAIRMYEQLIENYPEDGRTYVKLGMILAELRDYPRAESVLRAGLAAARDLVQAHYFLAVALFHQSERNGMATATGRNQAREAAQEAKATLALKPDHGFAHLYLGLVLKAEGRMDEALVEFREAVRCTPDATDTHLHLGLTLADMKQTAEAIRELDAAVRLASQADSRPQTALDRIRKTANP